MPFLSRNIPVSFFVLCLLAACSTNTPEVALTTGKISSLEGKPGAPVSLTYQVPNAPAVGKEATITLVFTVDSSVDDLEIDIAQSQGVNVVDAQKMSLGAQKPGSVHEYTVRIIPLEEGMRYVNIFAATRKGEHQRRRTFAVPVAGGGKRMMQKNNGQSLEMPDGEKVISMPAEESRFEEKN